MRDLAQPGSYRHGAAAQERGGRHGLAPRTLQFQDPNRALAASDRETAFDDCAGHARTLALGRAQHLDATRRAALLVLRPFKPCTGKWRQSANAIVHLLPWTRPLNARFVLVDLIC